MDKTTPMKLKPLVNATCKLGNKGCFDDGRCHALGNCENKITTNADRIRAMSDEELEKLLTRITDDAQSDARTKCNYQWGEWLRSEVEVEHEQSSINT